MSDLTETVVTWAMILIALRFFIRAVRRHRQKPQYRMYNPFDPEHARPEPGQPFFAPGAWEWAWYVAGFSTSALFVHLVVTR